jgi:predicted metal-binding protein
MMSPRQLCRLVQTAVQLGASAAGVMGSQDIVIEDDLARLCNGNPPCQLYGLAPSCPPHVAGPEGFRQWQKKSRHAIAVRIDVPTAAMFSDERRGIMQLLHEIVAGVEQQAVRMGYADSKGLAGGSCKKIFCHAHDTCRVLAKQGECRNPQLARPSMSGFGIHVTKLMQSLGWPADIARQEAPPTDASMTWVAGLILIADADES